MELRSEDEVLEVHRLLESSRHPTSRITVVHMLLLKCPGSRSENRLGVFSSVLRLGSGTTDCSSGTCDRRVKSQKSLDDPDEKSLKVRVRRIKSQISLDDRDEKSLEVRVRRIKKSESLMIGMKNPK